MKSDWLFITGVFTFTVILSGCHSSQPNKPLTWHNETNYRWAEVDPGKDGYTGFKQLSPGYTNITFENMVSDSEIASNRDFLNGSGVAAGDYDGDGLIDLYFCSLDGHNKLYKNLGGMKFRDVTEEAGVAHSGYQSTGAVFADVNGDGKPDLLVSSLDKNNTLYINNGDGTFTLDKNSGLGPADGSMTMTLADIDNDGDLDLYITNYKSKSDKDIYPSQQLTQDKLLITTKTDHGDTYSIVPKFKNDYQIIYTKDHKLVGVAEAGVKDELYLNDGHGTFKKVTNTDSVFLDENGKPFGLQRDWGLSAKFQDLNNDGLPDLYVCNDFYSPDRIWINQGNGTFKAIGWKAIRDASFSSMAVDFSDINRDGKTDIFTTEMLSPKHDRRLRQMGSDNPTSDQTEDMKSCPQYNRNSLYLQQSDGTFAQIAYLSGLEATGWSWAAKFMDIDLDGYEDLIVNTGYLHDILDIDTQLKLMHENINMDDHFGTFLKMTPPLELHNKMFKNNGDLTFTDKSADWGFKESDVSQGMAVADLDNDGDLDFVSNRLNKTATVFENMTNAPRILVRLKGNKPNTEGIGANIRLEGGKVPQEKQISAGGDYLSGSAPSAMFAANGKRDGLYRIIVAWPNHRQSIVDSVKANRIYEVYESGSEKIEKDTLVKIQKTLFKDVSDRVPYAHHENNFDDYNLQPLLPAQLSRLGPGVSWIDYNGDGNDDLFIASGKDGEMGIFQNDGKGYFRQSRMGQLTGKAPGDQTTILGWKANNKTHIMLGSANYEQGKVSAPSAYQYTIEGNHAVANDSIQGILSTTGPLAMADYNNDGTLDLFVGGNFLPGHYPINAPSRLFKNENGHFVLDTINSKLLENLGLVTGAVFTDYDGDGQVDLLVSTEWGTLHLFKNEGGFFHDVTQEVGLDKFHGWWKGVATGDFNNDGRPDIIATNIGQNSPYELAYGKPLRMYYGDFNRDGITDIIEAESNGQGQYVPRRRLYNYESFPMIANSISSYKQFAGATLSYIFGNNLPELPYKEINTLQTMLFINTPDGFKAYPLPIDAQFTAAFSANVADFNNDGNEDVFLSQNFFDFPPQVPRLDAGRGLLLLGNGKGNFTAVPAEQSGIKIYGEQRGAAVADFNGDGKVDLAVSQNNEPLKLYLNETPNPGIRVRLQGPPQNAFAIGSSMRLVYADGTKGPIREIQAGSGYWSQNSCTQVLGKAKSVKSIEVTWFDGKHQTVPVKDDARVLSIAYAASK